MREGDPTLSSNGLPDGSPDGPPHGAVSDPATASRSGAADTEAVFGSISEQGVVVHAERVRPLARGETLGRYVILEPVGRGGMSIVYAAYDPELDRRVALKLLLPRGTTFDRRDAASLRLQREAQAIARVSHPNVIAVHDVGVENGQVFLAMEFVEGRDLRGWLERRPPLAEIVSVFLQAGEGLSAAHQAGLVHRDFKPDNALLGDDGRVRVVDFGLVRRADEMSEISTDAESDVQSSGAFEDRLTRAGAVLGTPAYMAPEQMRGDPADERSDQFAFCVAFYEALFRERPFAGNTFAELTHAVTLGEVRVPANIGAVPTPIHRALMRGLSRRAEDRYPNMAALLAELRRDPSARRKRVALVGGLAIAVVGVGLLAYRQGSEGAVSLCTGAHARRVEVWDERLPEMQAAFEASGEALASAMFERATSRMGSLLDDWERIHRDACEATRVRGEQSEEILDLQMECLDARMRDVNAVADTFAEAHRLVVLDATMAVAGIRPPSFCTDIEGLRQRVRPPDDPVVRARVAQLRDDLSRAESLQVLGKHDEARAIRLEVRDVAETLGYAPMRAEAAVSLLEDPDRSVAEARAASEAAFELALAVGHDEVAIEVALGYSFLLAEAREDLEEAEAWLRRGEALIERIGGADPHGLTARTNRAFVVARRGRYEEAERIFADLIHDAEQKRGTRVQVAVLYNNLGAVLGEAGKYEEAMKSLEKAQEIRRVELGLSHPQTMQVTSNLGLLAVQLGRDEEAARRLEMLLALTDLRSSPGYLPNVCVGLSRAHENLGNHARAIEVAALGEERSKTRYGVESYTHADTLRQLGHAQWSAGQRERGLATLEDARDVFDRLDTGGMDAVGLRVWLLEERANAGELEAALEEARLTIAQMRATKYEPCQLRAMEALLGDLELRSGDRAAARRAYQTARDIHWVDHHLGAEAGQRARLGFLRLGDFGPPTSEAARREAMALIAEDKREVSRLDLNARVQAWLDGRDEAATPR